MMRYVKFSGEEGRIATEDQHPGFRSKAPTGSSRQETKKETRNPDLVAGFHSFLTNLKLLT